MKTQGLNIRYNTKSQSFLLKKIGFLIVLLSCSFSLLAQFGTSRATQSGRYKVVMIGSSSIEPKAASTYYPCLGAEVANNKVANDVQYTKIGADNASSADVDPSIMGTACGAKVKYAYLYWGGSRKYSSTLSVTTLKYWEAPIAIKGPSMGTYPASFLPDAWQIPTNLNPTTKDNRQPYYCVKDVSSILANEGTGTFSVKDITADLAELSEEGGPVAAWNLILLYESPEFPEMSFNLYDGIAWIANDLTITKDVAIAAPATGDISSFVGVACMDGDVDDGTNKADQMTLQSDNGGSLISLNTLRGVTDVLSSTMTYNGSQFDRYPACINTLGYDAHHVDLPDGSVKNSATKITVKLNTSSGDGSIYPFMMYTGIIKNQPQLRVTKVASSPSVVFGQTYQYMVIAENIGGRATSSQATEKNMLRDTLDYNVVFSGLVSDITVKVNGVAQLYNTQANVVWNSTTRALQLLNLPVVPKDGSMVITYKVTVADASHTELWRMPCMQNVYNKAKVTYYDDGVTPSKQFVTFSGQDGCNIGDYTVTPIVADFTQFVKAASTEKVVLPSELTATFDLKTYLSNALSNYLGSTNGISGFTFTKTTAPAAVTTGITVNASNAATYTNANGIYTAIRTVATHPGKPAACSETYTVKLLYCGTNNLVLSKTQEDIACVGAKNGKIIPSVTVAGIQGAAMTYTLANGTLTDPSAITSVNQLATSGRLTSGMTNYTFEGLSQGTYTVFAIDGLGCYRQTPVTLADPTPIAVTLNATAACVGNRVDYTASASGGVTGTGYNWKWYRSTDGTTWSEDPIQNTSTVYSVTSTQPTIYMKAEASSSIAECANVSCKSSTIKSVTLDVTPDLTMPNQGICPGGSATLTPVDSKAATITSRVWKSSTDSVTWTTIADVTPTITKSPAVTTNYRAIFGTAGGCKDSVIAKIIVSPVPTIAAITSPTALCVGSSLNPTAPTVTLNGATLAATSPTSWQLENTVGSGTYTDLAVPYTVVIGDNGKKIRYRVTTTCSTYYSNEVDITVNPLTAITTQPIAATTCAGTSASFSVVATGTGTLTYQWRKGGVNISGATSATYTIASPAAADAANYDVIVTGTCGSVTSTAVALTVNAITTITTQPVAATTCAGISASFSVVAAGNGTLTYQWRKGGANISGATSATYTIASPAAADAANYDVIVTGTCGSATSTAVALTVNPLTAITTQPVAATTCAGTSASFSVVATGTGILTYQWRKGGVNISSATSNSYTIASPVAADAASYDVIVTGDCGSVTSTAVALTVNAVTVITTQPIAATTCAGTSASFSVVATGTGTLTYQWRKGGVNISGATSATYTIASPAAADAANYDVIVTGTCGSVTSTAVALTVNAVTTITTQPVAAITCAGISASFSVVAAGTGTLTYQWRKGGVNISGATSNSYTITTPTATDAANYDVVVTSSCGSATSTAVALTVNALPTINVNSPAICSGLSASLTATGASTYTWSPATGLSGTSGASVTASPASTTVYTISAIDANTCVNSTTSTVTVNQLPTATISPATPTTCAGVALGLTASPSGGSGTYTTHAWTGTGTGSLDFTNIVNPNFSSATAASYPLTYTVTDDKNCVSVPVNTSVTVNSCTNPSLISSSPAHACLNGNFNIVLTLSNLGASAVNNVSVANALPAGFTYVSVVASLGTYNDATGIWTVGTIGASGTATLTLTVSGNTVGTYTNEAYVATVDALTYGSYAAATASLKSQTGTIIDALTTITTQPSAVTTCAGTSASLSVAATGTGTLTYQWRKGGVNISSATSDTYTITSPTAADAANYDVVITGTCGSVTSSAVALTVNAQTAITTQPVAATTCAGTSASFSVVATGTGTLTYQWRKGGVNISGATSDTYTITSPTAADAANYDVVVTGTCGSVTSSAVALTVNAVTTITTQPVAATTCAGTSVSFDVVATGTGILTYQWRKGGVNISGATSDTYTIASPVAADADNYDVLVSSSCGSATSTAVSLTVNALTTIATQPLAQTTCVGGSASFSVVGTGTGSFTYQWRKAGVNIAGATSDTYTVSTAALADAANYDVVVTGTCNSVTSAAVSLTVNLSTTITTQPVAQTVCEGAFASFSVVAGGLAPITYQWRKGGVNISGATSDTYTISTPVAADAANYDVEVTSGCGSVTSTVAALTVNALTTITTQPVAVTTCAGTSASFSVVATGTGTLTYQWRKGGVNISGATSDTYTITSPIAADAANYDVVVTGSCSSATSTAVALTVNALTTITTQPIVATTCAGTSASFSVVALGTGTLTYQWRKGGVNVSGATSDTYTISSPAAADAANYDVEVTGTCGSVSSTAVALAVNPVTTITTQPVAATTCVGTSASFSVVATGTGTLTYQWRKGGVNISGANSDTYTIASPTAADAANYDVLVSSSCGSVTSTTVALTVNALTAITTQPVAQSTCIGGSASFTVVATGTGTLTYQWRKAGVNIAGATSDTYTIPSAVLADAANYDVIVTGTCGSETSLAVSFTVNTSTTITTQPVAKTVCPGTSASFTVVGSGSGTITYQWRKGGVNISGAILDTYTISSTVAADADNYDVIVTSGCGSTTSNAVALTVNTITSITTAPVAATTCAGTSASFSVVATGTGTLTYQWRKGGVNISGATSDTYTISSPVAADVANYDVEVVGTCNSVTSAAVALTVNALTTITTQPVAATACVGTSTSFSVVAAGTGTLTYQWRKGGVNISGATSDTYTISSSVAGDAANFDVIVTGTCGSVTSTAVALTVNPLTIIATSPVATTTCAGTSASFSVVATGTGTLTYQWRKAGVDISGATSDTYTILSPTAAAAANYDVIVTGTCNSVTSTTGALTVNPVTTITTQPVTVTTCAGTSASFSVVASGTGTLSYQWRKAGVNILGATSATYTVASPVAADASNYDVLVSSTCGSVTSTAVALTMNTAPTITAHPVDVTVCPSTPTSPTSATFNVTATGTGPLTYQWRKNKINIAGANLSSYTINPVTIADSASYDVIVGGICSPADTSNVAKLKLNAAPSISLDPQPVKLCPGGAASFSVTAAGTGITYQWKKGVNNIVGATASTYSIPSVALTDAASYSVTVSGTCPSPVTSTAASLTVNARPTSVVTGADEICIGEKPVVTVSFTGLAPWTFTFNRGGTNDTIVTTSVNPYTFTVAPTVTTTYRVTALVDSKCTAIGPDMTGSALITVIPPPSISLVSGPIYQDLLCGGQAISPVQFAYGGSAIGIKVLGVPSVPNGIVTSALGNTLTVSGTVPDITQDYMILLTPITVCPADSQKILFLNVKAIPEVNLALLPSQSKGVCLGTPLQFNATLTNTIPSTTVNYTWTTQSGVITNSNPSLSTTPTVAGSSVAVSVKATRGNCVSQTKLAYGTVYPLPAKPKVGKYTECALPTGSGVVKWNDLVKLNGGSAKWYVHQSTAAFVTRDISKSTPTDTLADVKAVQTTNGVSCVSKDSAVVIIKVFEKPQITRVIKSELSNIQLEVMNGTLPYSYSVSGKTGTFFDPTADLGIIPFGTHKVTVSDLNTCTSTVDFTIDPVALEPEKFFTPNGDGDNDTWDIKNLEYYPNSEVYIHDRFGKELMNVKAGKFKGWDGLYQASSMPSTDYWYIIYVHETGKRILGHFLLKR